MEIISHRGFWIAEEEKNSKVAFLRALENGFGIETDIRDFNSDLVISHDFANQRSMKIDEFFSIYNSVGNKTRLALNIKSDGLQTELKKKLEEFSITNYFVFDMSVPDSLRYLDLKMNTYRRISEYEKQTELVGPTQGIWLDAFKSDWYILELSELVKKHERICIVSPELHKREYLKAWSHIKEIERGSVVSLEICTDHPVKAREYFCEK